MGTLTYSKRKIRYKSTCSAFDWKRYNGTGEGVIGNFLCLGGQRGVLRRIFTFVKYLIYLKFLSNNKNYLLFYFFSIISHAKITCQIFDKIFL